MREERGAKSVENNGKEDVLYLKLDRLNGKRVKKEKRKDKREKRKEKREIKHQSSITQP